MGEPVTDREFLQSQIDSVRREHAAALGYIKDNIEARERTIYQAVVSIERNLNDFKTAVETRFVAMNEIRAAMSDAAARGITRTEVISLNNANSEKISDLSSRIDKKEGSSSGMSHLWLIAVGAISIVLAALSFFRK